MSHVSVEDSNAVRLFRCFHTERRDFYFGLGNYIYMIFHGFQSKTLMKFSQVWWDRWSVPLRRLRQEREGVQGLRFFPGRAGGSEAHGARGGKALAVRIRAPGSVGGKRGSGGAWDRGSSDRRARARGGASKGPGGGWGSRPRWDPSGGRSTEARAAGDLSSAAASEPLRARPSRPRGNLLPGKGRAEAAAAVEAAEDSRARWRARRAAASHLSHAPRARPSLALDAEKHTLTHTLTLTLTHTRLRAARARGTARRQPPAAASAASGSGGAAPRGGGGAGQHGGAQGWAGRPRLSPAPLRLGSRRPRARPTLAPRPRSARGRSAGARRPGAGPAPRQRGAARQARQPPLRRPPAGRRAAPRPEPWNRRRSST